MRQPMRVEVLHIDDCPNWVEAGRRLQDGLEGEGFSGVRVTFRLVSTAEDAVLVPFAGSPTLLVDGLDLFPSEGRTTDLACRIYRTPAGLAGLPTEQQIRQALREHPRARAATTPVR